MRKTRFTLDLMTYLLSIHEDGNPPDQYGYDPQDGITIWSQMTFMLLFRWRFVDWSWFAISYSNIIRVDGNPPVHVVREDVFLSLEHHVYTSLLSHLLWCIIFALNAICFFPIFSASLSYLCVVVSLCFVCCIYGILLSYLFYTYIRSTSTLVSCSYVSSMCYVLCMCAVLLSVTWFVLCYSVSCAFHQNIKDYQLYSAISSILLSYYIFVYIVSADARFEIHIYGSVNTTYGQCTFVTIFIE